MGLMEQITNEVRPVKDMEWMEESAKLAKFSVLVDDLYDRSRGVLSGEISLKDEIVQDTECYEENIVDAALALIFDYEKMNDYAKIIMRRCPVETYIYDEFAGVLFKGSNYKIDSGWSFKTAKKFVENNMRGYSDIKSYIENAKAFVKEQNEQAYCIEAGYKLIFWSLMVLAVDKTNEDKHISMICNFAKMLDILDEELEDIIYIIKLIFNKVDGEYNFKTDTVVGLFGDILNIYSAC